MKRPWLRDLRNAHGLSQSALARLMAVDVRTISRWEAGVSTPGRQHRSALARLLGGEVLTRLAQEFLAESTEVPA